MTKKITRVISGVSLGLFIILVTAQLIFAQYVPVEESTNPATLLPVGSYIGLDCQDLVNLEQIHGFGASIMNLDCAVLSNNATGYEVQIAAAALTAAGSPDEITPMSDTPDVLNQADVAHWGLNSDVTAGADDTGWFGSGVITSASTPSSAEGASYTYRVGASVGDQAAVASGEYVGHVTVTASTIQ